MKLLFLFIFFCFSSCEQLDLFVSYNNSKFNCSNSDLDLCGKKENPFTSLLQSFYYLDLNMEMINKKYKIVNLVLLNKLYIMDSKNVTFYLNLLNTYYGDSETVWFFLKKMKNVSLTIKPLDSNTIIQVSSSKTLPLMESI